MDALEIVAQGRHSIPPEVIRRRLLSGLRYFATLHHPSVDAWQLLDDGGATGLVITIDSELPTMRAASTLPAANLPPALRSELQPALELLVERHHLEGLWLFGSWARGSASRRSDVDLLVMGLSDKRLLDAYDAVLEALQDCRLPIQPLLAGRALLAKHGNSPSGAR